MKTKKKKDIATLVWQTMARYLSQLAQPSNFVRANGWEDEEPFRSKIVDMRFELAQAAFRFVTAGGRAHDDDDDDDGGDDRDPGDVVAWRSRPRRPTTNWSRDSVSRWLQERCHVFAKGLSILRTDGRGAATGFVKKD